jgi:hypothetical protein
MKRVGILVAAVSLLLLSAAAFLRVWDASPAIGRPAFEQKFTGLLHQAGVRALGSRTQDADKVALPLALRIRESLTPRSQPSMVFGFPESVQQYALESVENRCRMECLVRYSRGAVAHVVLRYPSAAKTEAIKLRDGLRQLSDNMLVTLYENAGN